MVKAATLRRTGLEDAIRTALARARAVVLAGPRQSGKTTLARSFMASSSPEDDLEGFARFTRALGHRVQIVGDDLLVSDAALVRQAAAAGAANTVLLKPNQRGTLSETQRCWEAARELGYAAIVSARSGETEDTTIVDLAIGWGVGQLKVGSFARGERMAKWNEVLRIRERLGVRARFAGAGMFGRNPVVAPG